MNQLDYKYDFNGIKPIRDIVYESLRQSILEREIKPGERIVEKEYAEKFNISRTPIREALRKLEIEGLVEYIPRKGVVVKGFDENDIVEIYAIRKVLEILAIKSAIKNITDEELKKLKYLLAEMEKEDVNGNMERLFDVFQEFNEVMYKASKMPRLVDLINMLKDYLHQFRKITVSKRERKIEAISEHTAIVQAIIDKDEELVEKLVDLHLEKSKEALLENLGLSKK